MRVSETETFLLLPVVQWSHGPPPPPPPHTPPPTLIPLLPLFIFLGGRGGAEEEEPKRPSKLVSWREGESSSLKSRVATQKTT